MPKTYTYEELLDVISNTTVDQTQTNKNLISQNFKTRVHEDKFVFIKVNGCSLKVSYDDINYIEGLKDYIKIFVNDKSMVTKSTIKHIEEKLPSGQFIRIHKSYIVSIDKIDKIGYNHVFIGQKKIPIGMQFKDSFYDIIDRYRL